MGCFFPPNSFSPLLPLFEYLFGLFLGSLHYDSLNITGYVPGIGPGAAGSPSWNSLTGVNYNHNYTNMQKKKLQTVRSVVPGYEMLK